MNLRIPLLLLFLIPSIVFGQASGGSGTSGSGPGRSGAPNISYAKLTRSLDGGTYHLKNDMLHFQYTAEYKDGPLEYHIYDMRRNDRTPGTQLNTSYGDNRYSLDLSGLPSGTYTLEIINEKSEQFYLRFQR